MRGDEAGDGAEEGGLAGAVGADEGDDLAGEDLEGDGVEGLDGAVADDEVGNGEEGAKL